MVLGNLVVNEAHDVGANGGLEDGREADRGLGGLILLGVDGDEGASRGQRLKRR